MGIVHTCSFIETNMLEVNKFCWAPFRSELQEADGADA